MVLYNITIIMDETIHDQWLQWVQNRFIPGVMATNLFVSNRMLKVLDSPNEGITYCLQFVADELKSYNEYKTNHAQEFESKQHVEFENRLVSFSTIMEFIN